MKHWRRSVALRGEVARVFAFFEYGHLASYLRALLIQLVALLVPLSGHAIGLGTDLGACVPGSCSAAYPIVGNCSSFANRDNGYAIYVGGNYTITDGAEAEGRQYIVGNLIMNKAGLFNLVQVGVGACVVPVNSNAFGGVPHVIIGGSLQKNAGSLLIGDPNIVSDVLIGGTSTGTGLATSAGTITAGAAVPPPPESFASLQTKSTFWGTQTATGLINDDGYGGITFTGNGTSALQVFNLSVPSGTWGPSYGNTITYASIPANATVLINVTGAASINMITSSFTDSSNTDLTRRVLWNFPVATSVTLSGSSQWQGSVLVPDGNVTMSIPGFNGRMIVGRNLTQNCSGCEFHNYDFKGDLPAPAASCSLTIASATPTACAPATNTYGVTLNFSYTNPPAGETVNVGVTGASTQNIAQPGTSATFSGLTADGAAKAATAAFSGGTCTATNNNFAFTAPAPCSATTTTVSGRVYREASSTANTVDNGDGVDPGLAANVSLACTTPPFNAGPQATAADGAYAFTNVPVGASCTITETQPAGYTNAYCTAGAGATVGANCSAGGTGNSTITVTVPAGGSAGNNFAEQSVNTTSTTSCLPAIPVAPNTPMMCTVTCTNTGPGTAVGMSCAVTNAASLPGAPTPTCSPNANVVNGGALSCSVGFNAPSNGSVVVSGGSAATNDTDGGNNPTAGDNSSSANVNVATPCNLSISPVVPSACVAATNTYSATVNVIYSNAPLGETISVGLTGATAQSITQPSTSVTFSGLTADGASKSVTAAFATTSSCAATPVNFTAPASCAPILTTVSGRVYREASVPANNANDGNAVDPGLVTSVALSCTPTYTGTTPINTATDGTYSFANVAAGAICTITETQPPGYTNAYNTPGAGGTGNTGGTAGSAGDSTITLTVPNTGSPDNNFAEQSADMVSSVTCTPASGVPGTSVTCRAACTNNGPGTAVSAFCAIINASSLPGSPAPNCSAVNGSLAIGAAITCDVQFDLPQSTLPINVQAGTGAANDTNGGATATSGNNPSLIAIGVSFSVPALGLPAILLLLVAMLMLSARALPPCRR